MPKHPRHGLILALGLLLVALAGTALAATPVVTVGVERDGHARLSWDPAPSATFYEVRRVLDEASATATATPLSASPIPTATPRATLAAGASLVYDDLSVTNGRRYRYEVTTYDAIGPQSPSVLWVEPYAPPKGVTTVTWSTAYARSVSLSWDEADTTYPVAYYEVYRCAWTPMPTVTPTGTLPTATFTSTPKTPTATFTSTYTPTGTLPADTFTPTGTIPTATFTPMESVIGTSTPTPYASLSVLDLMTSSPAPYATVAGPAYLDEAATLAGTKAYYYWVRAVDERGNQGQFPSNTSSGVLPIATAPMAPALSYQAGPSVTPRVGPSGFGTRLSWRSATEGEQVGSYTVLRNSVPVATVVSTLSVTLTYEDALRDSGDATYQKTVYQLRTSNAAGTVMSNPVTVTLIPARVIGGVVAAPNATTGGVTLHWSNAVTGHYGLSGYNVFRSRTGLPTGTGTITPTPIAFVVAQPTLTTTPYFIDAGAANAHGASYWVAAVDAAAWMGPKTLATPSTLALAPTPPSSLTASLNGGNNRVQVAWDGSSGSFYGKAWYALERAVPSGTWTPVATVEVANTQYEDFPPVGLQTPVLYRVSALDRMGNRSNPSSASAPVTLQALVTPLPYPNYDVTAVIPPGTRSVSVAWNFTPTTGPASFGIYRSLAEGDGFQRVGEAPVSSTHYLDNNAPAGVTLFYRLTLRDGLNAESPLFPALTPDPVGHVVTWPQVPRDVTVTGGATAATLRWVLNATGEAVDAYQIYEGGTLVATVQPSPSPSVQIVQTPGIRSLFQVSASNASGEGIASNALTFLAAPVLTPRVVLTPPVDVTPTPGAVYVTGATYTGDVAGYNLYRSYVATPSVTPQEVLVGTLTAPQTALSDMGVAGRIVSYRLVARDANGVEAPLDACVAVTLGFAPGIPGTIWAEASASSVTLSWDPPVGDAPVTGYALYRSSTPGATPTLWAVSTDATPAFVDTPTTTGAVHYYRVAARNEVGEGALGAEKGVLFHPAPTVYVTPNAARHIVDWVPAQATVSVPVVGYVVSRAQEPATVFSQLGMVPVAAATPYRFVDSNISSGLTYVYRVAPATSGGVQGGWSDPVTQAALPLPVELDAISGDGFVLLHWAYQGGGGTTYLVQRRMGTQTDAAFQIIATGLKGTDYRDQDVVNKSLFVYRVVTVSSSGLTSVSPNFEVLPAKGPVVRGTVSASSGPQGVQLAWPAANPDGLDAAQQYPLGGYRIYRSVDGGGTYQFVGSCATTMYLDPVDVLSGETRTYQVRAVDAPPDAMGMAHESAYPPVTVESLSAHTALDRNALRPNGTVAERSVNVRFVVTRPGRVSIKVYSIAGVLVRDLLSGDYDKGVHWTSWDGTNRLGQTVASGVYLVTSTLPDQQETCKIAVIK